MLRRGTLSTAKFFRRANTHYEIESKKMARKVAKFCPGVCIVLAILLTIPAILSHNSQVRLISAVLGLAFVSVGVVIFIWKYFRVGVSAAAGVITIFLNGTLKSFIRHSRLGMHSISFL
jgi:hypothetical protein